MNRLRHLLLAIVALGLIAALAFLYDKTQAVDLRDRNEIASVLSALREIDGRWDVDVLRERSELDANLMAAPNRTGAAKAALANLRNIVPRTDSVALRDGLGELAKAILEKADLVEKYKAESGGAKIALHAILSSAKELGALPVEARKGDTRQMQQLVNELSFAAQQYYWLGKNAQPASLEMTAGQVRELAAQTSDAAREQAAGLEGAIQELLKHKHAEEDLFTKVSSLSSGPRLDNMSFSFNRELEATLQAKELYRVYLLAYAAALLIGVGYLGIRLKGANESLEQRVIERTRELSDALRHLKESEAQLIQSEKMSSLGQMVAGVAHEINTPLAYVKNSLATVNDRLPQIAAAIEHCEKLLLLLNEDEGKVDPQALQRQFAQTSALLAQLKQQHLLTELGGLVKDGIYGTGEMAEIVGNLKDFSRLDRSKVTSFNLNDGLASSLGLARHMLKAINVDRQFGEIAAITCAPSQINQVFLNLITNAAQALPATGGKITLKTRDEAGGVAVEVIDNGKGIAPDVLPKIFDPFFTTKEAGKGTGLGLSISFKIVQQHGGRITVASDVGKGTRFTVWLPLTPPAEAGLDA